MLILGALVKHWRERDNSMHDQFTKLPDGEVPFYRGEFTDIKRHTAKVEKRRKLRERTEAKMNNLHRALIAAGELTFNQLMIMEMEGTL